MRNNFFGSAISATPPTSPSTEQPAGQVSPERRGGKKLYIVVAALVAIVIIIVAVIFVPQGSADVISLGVDYAVGEKLTYDMSVTLSIGFGNVSSSVNANVTMTVEVLSFDGETYKLNYTVVIPENNPNVTLTNPNVNSRVLEVQKNEMVTVLALMPVAVQAAVTDEPVNAPLLAAVFDKSQARVGDTWQIPLSTEGSSSNSFKVLTVTFKAIQDVTVQAGTFKVFSLDFSSSYQNQSDSSVVTLSGQAQLECGSCKQIQSTLQLTASYQAGGFEYSIGTVIKSTLTQDSKP